MSGYAATWLAVLGGAAVCFATKLAGHLVPEHWLSSPRVTRIAGLTTIALLAALVVVQTFGAGSGITVDVRVVALLAAAIALALRAPFIVVVVLAALVAAGLRALGW